MFDSVIKLYKNRHALVDVSFTARRGEILGLLGPNGCGKSTTINVLCGLIRPDAGTVKLCGHDILRHPAAARNIVGLVSQDTALYQELTAEQNLLFHAQLYGIHRRDQKRVVADALALVGLNDRAGSRVATLSGGMKRRVAIARALLHEPPLVFLDEPTLGVDIPSRRQIWEHILTLRDRGTTIVLTTNYLEEAQELADRIAVMKTGRLVALDTTTELRRRYGTSTLRITTDHTVSPALLNRIRHLTGVQHAHTDQRQLQVSFADGLAEPADVLNLVAQERRLLGVAQRDATLDDVFDRLTTPTASTHP